jgi:hypothetical protein
MLIEREYYQTKIMMIKVINDHGTAGHDPEKFFDVIKLINWKKDDLIDAYVGAGSALPLGIFIVWMWLING